MTYFVYWCTECGKSFSEVDAPSRCNECGGDVDHDEREVEDEYWIW